MLFNLVSQQSIPLHQRLQSLLEPAFKNFRQFGQKVFISLDFGFEFFDSALQQPNHFNVAMTLVPNGFGCLGLFGL
ncbi:hypothetical protein [Synechococcus sp. KORDI-52]|uniref:hypothetical protein n=1 Tax=Synechococcus sp. KORDI-52 TaxID=585425 RepID=UPI00138E55F0|nr:hypothetical protein [Synechococcus sp. KORDI-52]